MSFDFSTLITNRSASDLENLRALLSTPVSDWTAEQMAQFNQAISKGAYNYTDLNRVTACMEYLDETLKSYGYETGYQKIEISHQQEPSSPLPDGYTLLEYIESTGTQYIDTGFKPNQDTRVVMDVQGISAGTYPYFGSRNATSDSAFILWMMRETNLRSDYGSKKVSQDVTSSTQRITIDKNKNVTTYGAYTITNQENSFSCNFPILILCQNTGGEVDSRKMSSQLYSCQIYDNGTLVRDLVPCKNPSSAVGLYDLVNDTFYGNAETGSFTAGPEAPEPEPTLDPYTWYEADIPTASQLAQYLSNVLTIWDTIMGDPTLPETMVNLTQEGANQIEAALIEINTAIEQIIAAMARSNSFTFWSGNRPFPTAYSNRGRNWAELDAMETSWRNWQVASWYLLLYGNLEAEGDVT